MILPDRQVAEIALRIATKEIGGIDDPPWDIEFTDLPNGGCNARWVMTDEKTISSVIRMLDRAGYDIIRRTPQ